MNAAMAKALDGPGAHLSHGRGPTVMNRPAELNAIGDGPTSSVSDGELQALYAEHSPGLIRHLRQRTGCPETARELAHEAFLRIVQLPPFRALTIRQPEAYLKRISTNLLRDWGRQQSRRATAVDPIDHGAASHLDQVAVLEARDTLRRLEHAISKLRPKTRGIFLAHRLDGLTYAEIAEQTGLSVKGVEKQMSKAIAKIDALLDRS